MRSTLRFAAVLALATWSPAQPAFDGVRATMVRQIAERRVAGAAAAIAIDGVQVFSHAVGMQNIEPVIRMTEESIFQGYGLTRPISHAAALLLVQTQRMQLDDPVEKYLPELAGLPVRAHGAEPVPAVRSVTIRDLLLGCSGYPSPAMRPRHGSTLASMVELLAQDSLLHQPGARVSEGYSTEVLARVVEVVSGEDFGPFVDVRLLQRMGLKNTAFYIRNRASERVASTLWMTEYGLARPVSGGPWINSYLDASGGIFTTAADYLRFAEMLRNGGLLGKRRILGPRMVSFLTTDQLDPATARPVLGTSGLGFGFSVASAEDAARSPVSAGTFQWGSRTGSIVWVDPARKLSAVYLANTTQQLGLGAEFRDAVYREL